MLKKRRDAHGFFRLDNTMSGLLRGFAATARGAGVFVLIWRETAFQLFFPRMVAEGRDEFAADSGNGLQQELAEVAEGDGLLLGDTALSHQKKNLGEGAVDVGGGGEVAAKRCEAVTAGGICPVRESSLVHAVLSGRRSCSDRRFGSVMNAELGTLVAALSTVGKSELAAMYFLSAAKLLLWVDIRGGRVIR